MIIFAALAFPQRFNSQTQRWEVEYDLPKFFHNSERINETEYQKLTVNVPIHRTA